MDKKQIVFTTKPLKWVDDKTIYTAVKNMDSSAELVATPMNGMHQFIVSSDFDVSKFSADNPDILVITNNVTPVDPNSGLALIRRSYNAMKPKY